MIDRLRAGGLAVVVVALVGLGAFDYWRRAGIGPVERGLQVASAKGCFACHGPGGVTGLADTAEGVGTVPPMSDASNYARNDDELRRWILDGRIEKHDDDDTGPPDLIRMPAWRGRLSESELSALVAYIKAVSDFEVPRESGPSQGRQAAQRLGCFGCHGPQGRRSTPNAGSLKGYIPAWTGPDFASLVHSDAELREWILDGQPKRFKDDRLARFFLERQVIQMPAYRGRVAEPDVDALVAYIRWLQKGR